MREGERRGHAGLELVRSTRTTIKYRSFLLLEEKNLFNYQITQHSFTLLYLSTVGEGKSTFIS